jgi:predicted RNase H-like HicB family nuclease
VKIKVVMHEAEEGGFWAEVPAIPGCATQGETMDELISDLHEAIEGCLAVEANMSKPVIFTISAAWDDEASV